MKTPFQFENKCFLITGVSNRKSVAYFTAEQLEKMGAQLVFTVQSEEHQQRVAKLFPQHLILVCDVEQEDQIARAAALCRSEGLRFDGLLHSLAFANIAEGMKPFHKTSWQDFSQATHISLYSFMAFAREFDDLFNPEASLVTVSISNTRATSYGFMGPIKAGLDSAVAFMAKSLSDRRIRCNAVCSGPLKTAASAGIPGYINNYLYAEKLTLRKEALKTVEVANTICFLLSPYSSGVNGTGLLVDAGMNVNTFDEEVVEICTR